MVTHKLCSQRQPANGSPNQLLCCQRSMLITSCQAICAPWSHAKFPFPDSVGLSMFCLAAFALLIYFFSKHAVPLRAPSANASTMQAASSEDVANCQMSSAKYKSNSGITPSPKSNPTSCSRSRPFFPDILTADCSIKKIDDTVLLVSLQAAHFQYT